jgi:hypothetical protein
MASPLKRCAVYQDLLQLADHEVAEIDDDELYVSLWPAAPHAVAASGLGSELWKELGPLWARLEDMTATTLQQRS